jgi:two-component system, NtrC family, sensor histidine kinase HydH
MACDPEQLRQVLLNLVINAIEASTTGSTIYLRTRMEKHRLFMEVEDSGSGIPASVADHIFDPFFTTKPDGTGLGLAISSMIATQHGGTLSFHDNANGGTTFQIDLPAE